VAHGWQPGTERFARLHLALCLTATAAAALAAVTGGYTFDILGVRVSMHAVTRPVVVAVAFGIAAVLAYRMAPGHTVKPENPVRPGEGWWLAAVFAALVGIASWNWGAHFAGGADSSGYLSQARLWQSGELRIPTPLAHDLTLTHGQYPFTPLGYQPAGAGMIVPGYPPGLPLLLASVASIGGEPAEHVVVPLSAAALVFVTFLLGRRLGGLGAGVIAAGAAAASPILVYQSTQPMSDVPAAFWMTLSVLLLTYESRAAAAAAGIAAAVACLVRPNLFVMTPVLVTLMWWWSGRTRRAVVNAAIFLCAPAASAVALSVLHRTLFGSVTTSGYGEIGTLFSLSHVVPNLARYPRWAVFTHSALLAAAAAAPIAIRRGWVLPEISAGRAERIAWSGLVFFAVLQVFYLLYLVFDDWVSFRFLLPALPWVLALQACAFAALCRIAPPWRRKVAVVVTAVLVASWGAGRARGLGAFQLMHSESRYLAVAEFARGRPPGTVFLTVQHSGSLPHNAAATILRWDWIEPGELDRVLAELAERRRPVVLVLDSFEVDQFRARFARTGTLTRLPAPMLVVGDPRGITSSVYDLGTTAGGGPVPFNSPLPPAPRDPRTPAGPDRGAGAASSIR
jgi:hypothetical protein